MPIVYILPCSNAKTWGRPIFACHQLQLHPCQLRLDIYGTVSLLTGCRRPYKML
jgi:hypothetical protein